MERTEVQFEIRLADNDLADDIESWLQEHDASGVARLEQRGLFPLLPLVVAGVVAGTVIVQLVMHIRDKTRCQVLIDARSQKIHKEIDCRVRDGRLIVLTSDRFKVQISDGGKLLDMTEVVTAALSGGWEAVSKAAEALGAHVVADPLGPEEPK